MSSSRGIPNATDELLERISAGSLSELHLSKLVANALDLNAQGANYPVAPLVFAVANGQADAVRMLHRAGAAITAKGEKGRSLLMIAANGGAACIPQLLQAGLDINDTDESGDTALIIAVRNHDRAAISVLLQAGANPDLPNHSGKSAWDYNLAALSTRPKGESGS